MKIYSFALPLAAAGAAVLLLAPGDSVAFTTIGGSLSLSQRDVRIFDNYTDATANNNTTPHAMFPGYTGIEMACWKACIEWGSGPHGDGTGDPLQTTLGSGGANFDISWQGNATAVGGTNDNTHSEIPGSSGGVLAFTEIPISDGWRIRYYAGWTWHDGPGSVTGGGSNFDLQGIACHEYGHALGLGHTNVGGSTMFASASSPATAQRSIEADDIAGVQFIYGVKLGSKPEITAVTTSSGSVTITGSNFSATGNEVWFTMATQNTTGNPVKVTGVTSNGTQITVAVPATAGPGDLLVKNGAGGGNGNLSDAFPVDPLAGPTCGSTVYCTAKVSSNFCTAAIADNATQPSLSNPSAYVVNTTGMEDNKNCLTFFGLTGQSSAPFQGGILCVKNPLYRLAVKNSGGAGTCQGSASYTLADMVAHPSGGSSIFPSSVVDAQTWFRDPGDPFTTGLSNAIEFTVCP